LDPARTFLGRGLAFPLRLDAKGRLATVEGEELVAQAIRLVLMTNPGERAMRPRFGAGLAALVFEAPSPQTMLLVERRVREALVRFEPRVDVDAVSATADPNEPARLLVRVAYRVRATDTVLNLVFPFYIERGVDPGVGSG
jgi:phage baseplate assembly protein W